jgi:hypothetical protein
MTPERIAELRQRGARRREVRMWHYEAAALFDELARLRAREAELSEALEHVADSSMWHERSDGLLEWRGATHFMDIADTALSGAASKGER